MNTYLEAAQRLYNFLREAFWKDNRLTGPDVGIRFNSRVGRFIKGYLPFIPWHDNYYYLQAQGYWIFDNWQVHDAWGEESAPEIAARCAESMIKAQLPDGSWPYPNPEWAGRIATVEGDWAGLGLLKHYERSGNSAMLDGAIRWYRFLIDQIGFVKTPSGLVANYFGNRPGGIVPNPTTLTLAFLSYLARVTNDQQYLAYAPQMISFIASVQTPDGEIPYSFKDAQGRGKERPHFQCYQYNAFQLIDLAMYHRDTGDDSVLPIIQKIAGFIATSVQADGHTRFDVTSNPVQVPYNTASIAAALLTARQMGLSDTQEVEERAYRYVLAQQHPNGSFGFSKRNYRILHDARRYPRPQTMILYHLLLKAAETTPPSPTAVPVRPAGSRSPEGS